MQGESVHVVSLLNYVSIEYVNTRRHFLVFGIGLFGGAGALDPRDPEPDETLELGATNELELELRRPGGSRAGPAGRGARSRAPRCE